MKKTLLTCLVTSMMAGCALMPSAEQSVTANLADNLSLKYTILDNQGAEHGLDCKTLGAEWALCNKVNIELINNGYTVTSKDWAIYFHSIRLVLDVENDQFKITHITGDLHKLEPTDKFRGFEAGKAVNIPIISGFWQLFESDFMPRAYVVAGDSEPKVIESLNTENTSSYVDPIIGEQIKRTTADNNVAVTAASRFEKNSDVITLSAKGMRGTILPTPLKSVVGKNDVSIKNGIKLPNDVIPAEMLESIEERANLLGLDTSGDLPVSISLAPKSFAKDQQTSGAYKLVVDGNQIRVTGFDNVGAYYGLQSLLSLVKIGSIVIPEIKVEDAPRFEYRGIMVDVARNFHSKAAIKRTMDQMAAYKLNKLHLHISDDEGWRLEIPGLPELTDIGASRCHDLSETRCLLPQLGSGPTPDNSGSGYLSRADYIDILNYAKARGIEVIPEQDMPAHSRAAVVAMEARYNRLMAAGRETEANEYRLMDPDDTSNVTTVQFYDKQSFINPCMDSSLNFVNKVISEVSDMHKEAGMPLSTWHFGGDEAKNIKLGAGFQDIKDKEYIGWKGSIDLGKQDKPFEKSPVCQKLIDQGVVSDADHLPSHFAEQVSKVVAAKGIPTFQAWQDGLKHSRDSKSFATENTNVNFWDVLYWGGVSSAYDWAAKGYDVIISSPDYVYMDFPYEVDSKEPGYYWATRATDTRKMFTFAPENLPQNAETSVDRDANGFAGVGKVNYTGFHGLSAQLWSETVRTDAQYEYMVFPRVIAVAERAWHKADWETDYKANREFNLKTNFVNKKALNKDWTRFTNMMGQKELAKMDASGVQYRIPVPGARIVNGKLEMNISMPGLPMQFSTDLGKTWTNYDATNLPTVESDVMVRALSADGKREGRATKAG